MPRTHPSAITSTMIIALAGAAAIWAATRTTRPSPPPVCEHSPVSPQPSPTQKPASPTPSTRRRRSRLLLWLLPAIVAAAAATTAATPTLTQDWARWTLAGIAITVAACLVLAILIGPAARRLAGERQPLSDSERSQTTVTERVETVNAARHTLIQAATGLVVIGGVVFTAQSLWYTAQILDTSRQAQVLAEQGQITDRYAKAVEQLGSGKLDVRLGGIYALERLAQDSPRDHQTIYDVLAAFIREHHSISSDGTSIRPATDIQAALTVVGRRTHPRDTREVNLAGINVPGADLNHAHLAHADLTNEDLCRRPGVWRGAGRVASPDGVHGLGAGTAPVWLAGRARLSRAAASGGAPTRTALTEPPRQRRNCIHHGP